MFSNLLKDRRSEMGLSLDKLSELSGVKRTTIHAYEKGSIPTIDQADRLLKALGITMIIGKDNTTTPAE